MISQLSLSAGIVAATIVLHAVLVAICAFLVRRVPHHKGGVLGLLQDSVVIAFMFVWLFLTHYVSIAVWAFVFIHLDIVKDWEAGLYFAGATYTTLGFGDILAPVQWRLLTGASAINGLLLIGMSTAFLVDASRSLHLWRE